MDIATQDLETTVPDGPVRKKWGVALAAGFVVVPTVLLKAQGKLGLSSDEVMVLVNLFLTWREAADTPYPRTSTIARRMGVGERTVQRQIVKLEEKELIRRIWGQPQRDGTRTLTRYDMSGVLTKRKRHAEAVFPAGAR